MKKEYCSHCGKLIIDVASESGPSIIREGVVVFCNKSCFAGKTDKLKPNKLNALGIAVGFLGGNKVNSVIRNTIDRVNKDIRF